MDGPTKYLAISFSRTAAFFAGSLMFEVRSQRREFELQPPISIRFALKLRRFAREIVRRNSKDQRSHEPEDHVLDLRGAMRKAPNGDGHNGPDHPGKEDASQDAQQEGCASVARSGIAERRTHAKLADRLHQAQDEAISEGWASLEKYKEYFDLWALAREGLMRGSSGKEDVLVVAAWTHGMSEPVVFVQQFLPKGKGGFALVGPMIAQDCPPAELPRVAGCFMRGVDEHPQGHLWQSWRGE